MIPSLPLPAAASPTPAPKGGPGAASDAENLTFATLLTAAEDEASASSEDVTPEEKLATDAPDQIVSTPDVIEALLPSTGKPLKSDTDLGISAEPDIADVRIGPQDETPLTRADAVSAVAPVLQAAPGPRILPANALSAGIPRATPDRTPEAPVPDQAVVKRTVAFEPPTPILVTSNASRQAVIVAQDIAPSPIPKDMPDGQKAVQTLPPDALRATMPKQPAPALDPKAPVAATPIPSVAPTGLEKNLRPTGHNDTQMTPIVQSDTAKSVAAVAQHITKSTEQVVPKPLANRETSKGLWQARSDGETAYRIAATPPSGMTLPQQAAQTIPAASHDPRVIMAADVTEVLARSDSGPITTERTTPIAPTITPTMPAADQARQIAQQMAAGMPTRAPGTTEINLQPEELGRVKMSLTLQDGIMMMAIQAERPETLDLMRRHIDQLAQSYREMGFENMTFSFSGSSHHNSDSFGESVDIPEAGSQPETISANDPAAIASDGRLDLRM